MWQGFYCAMLAESIGKALKYTSLLMGDRFHSVIGVGGKT